jgi:hypothetical protein
VLMARREAGTGGRGAMVTGKGGFGAVAATGV